MLPIHDENYERPAVPFIKFGLILINILVFVYQLSLPDRAMNDFIVQYSTIPADISHFQNLQTLLTSQFLHGSFLHIGGNMLYL